MQEKRSKRPLIFIRAPYMEVAYRQDAMETPNTELILVHTIRSDQSLILQMLLILSDSYLHVIGPTIWA